MAGSLAGVEGTIGQASAVPLTLVISTHFKDEFFLKQRLRAGCRVRPGWSSLAAAASRSTEKAAALWGMFGPNRNMV